MRFILEIESDRVTVMFRLQVIPADGGLIKGCNRVELELIAAGLFSREMNRARLDGLTAHIIGKSMRLLNLSEIRNFDPSCQREPPGSQTIPIDRIRGSESRCDDFDSDLRPLQDHTRQRWINIAVARISGTPLPAVNLIHLCGFYFIRDGHHRISVARALGERYIDAVVTVG